MFGLHQLFTVEELQALDPKELEILKEAIRNEIATSPEVQAALRPKARDIYARLRSGSTQTGT